MFHQRWLRLLLIVLAVAILPLSVALAQDEAGTLPATSPPPYDVETEPNDTIATADYLNLVFGPLEATIAPARDKDYFYFDGYPGLEAHITLAPATGSPLRPVLVIYSDDGQELTRKTCGVGAVCQMTFPTPDGAFYYLRVTDSKNKGGSAYGYALSVVVGDPNEPNDTIATATPLTMWTEIWGVIAPAGDVDYYSFFAEAGDEFEVETPYMNFWLYGPNGEDLGYLPAPSQPYFKVKETGVHYLKAFFEAGEGPYPFEVRPVERPLLVSFATAGTLGGVAFEPADILLYSPLTEAWQLFFDASDIGLANNVVSFDWAGSLLLTLGTKQTLPGLGVVKPQDILRFVTDSYPSEDTVGVLAFEYKGANIGLTTANETIDALGGTSYAFDLSVSTKGAAVVPGVTGTGNLKAQKDDVVVFAPNLDGQGNHQWYTAINGATLGLKGANLVGLDQRFYLPQGWYMAFDRAVTLGGVTYDPNDVILCWESGDLSCESFETAFDSALFGGYPIDAIDVMAYEYE